MARILIAEDNPRISSLERNYLETCGYEAVIAGDGNTAVSLLKKEPWDLLILDVTLPGKNGFEICRDMRDQIDIPILMVTAKGGIIDRIRGLNLGADDYIVKPFEPEELMARVRSHLLRYKRLKHAGEEQERYHCLEEEFDSEEYALEVGSLKVLTKSWKVIKNGREIRLPNREFELLKYLCANPNIVFSKEYLLERIWGYDYAGSGATVMVHINRIREKIEDDPKNPKIIETIWGAGYRLNVK